MAHSYTDQGCRVPLFPASPQELVRISAKFSATADTQKHSWFF